MSNNYRRSCYIDVNDVFEDLSHENRRLAKELIFVNKCLKYLIEFKSLVELNSHSLRDGFNSIQLKRYEELSQIISELLSDDLRHNVNQLFTESEVLFDNQNKLSQRLSYVLTRNECNEETEHQMKSQTFEEKSEKKSTKSVSNCLKSRDGQFKCTVDDCEKKFFTRRRLTIHTRRAHREQRLKCTHNLCQRVFKSKDSLKIHVSQFHSGPELSCDWPECRFTGTKSELKDHELSHSEQQFYCTFKGCDQSFGTFLKMKYHRRRHTMTDTLKCTHNECQRTFKILENLKKHLKNKHPNSELKLRCDRIGCQYIGSEEELKEHRLLHKEENRREKMKDKEQSMVPYVCSWPGCEYRTSSYSNMAYHKHKHTGFKIRCSWAECKLTFPNRYALSKHIDAVHKKIRSFVCRQPECQFRSATKTNLRLHMDTHLPESLREETKTFTCDWPGCETKWRTLYYLKRHMISHQNDNPIKCSHPGCDFQTGREQSLKNHFAVHSSERNYVCDECGKRYKTTKCIYQHKRVVHKKIRSTNKSE